MSLSVRRVEASVTFPLRQRVLRPHETPAQMALAGDDEADSGHFGAFSDGEVVATASVRRKPPPWALDHGRAWQLRGMATAEEWRNQGVGTAMLASVVDHVGEHGGGLLWCNARVPALSLYRRAGFVARGESWIDPALGPHIAMERTVEAASF